MPRMKQRRGVGIRNSEKAGLRKASGDTSEQYFKDSHEVYLRTGWAKIVKQHPPVIGPPTALRYSGGAFVDYMGAIEPHGHLVAFDVKGCTGSVSLKPDPIPKDPSNFKAVKRALKDRDRLQRQAKLLMELRVMGASVAFFCIDLHLERLWIVEDVERVAKLEPVPFRSGKTNLVPTIPFSTLLEIAQGVPPINFLKLWPNR